MKSAIANNPRAPINDAIVIAIAALLDGSQAESSGWSTRPEFDFRLGRVGLNATCPLLGYQSILVPRSLSVWRESV